MAKHPTIPGFDISTVLSTHRHTDVFQVRSQTTAKHYALKLAKTEIGTDRINKECLLLQQFATVKGLACCMEQGTLGNMPFLLMPLYQRSLYHYLHNLQEPMPLAEAVDIISQLSTSLAYIHEQGIIHCDLHPQNVMQDQDGSWLIIDFAGAQGVNEMTYLNTKRQGAGAPPYASQEQMLGLTRLSYATDVHALCAIFCALLSGELHQDTFFSDGPSQDPIPFDLDTQQHLFRSIQKAHEKWLSHKRIAQNIPLHTVLCKGLSEHSSARFNSSQLFLEDIRRACQASDITDHDLLEEQNVLPSATFSFSHSIQFNDEIYAIKQSILDALKGDGYIDTAGRLALISHYKLHDKISTPEQVIQELINEAEHILQSDTEHIAFLQGWLNGFCIV